MALYRKYRPQKFKQVIGQDPIKKTIVSALQQNRISHAYLFSGPKGVGKTTLARLLAKSLNCEKRSPQQAEPCDECLSCQEIREDRSLDVIEIDAASNRGIDEIRELKEKIKFAPSRSKYKIYIIDEVHMLTREAFNALLKTLEEPPPHIIFIMATTEPHRVPETILSRAQQFDFKRASVKEILSSLNSVAKSENVLIEDEALEMIAVHSQGSFRDALSLLDQVISLGAKKISLKQVREILGLVPGEMLEVFLRSIEKSHTRQAIDLINKFYEAGYDLGQFTDSIIDALRKKMLFTNDYSLLKPIDIFLEAKEEIKNSNLPQLPLEMAVIKICGNKINKNSSEEIKKRSEKIEPLNNSKTLQSKSVSLGSDSIQATGDGDKFFPSGKDVLTQETDQASATSQRQKVKAKKNRLSMKKLQAEWSKILQELKQENQSLSIILTDAQPVGIKEDTIELVLSNKFYLERLREPKKYQKVTEVFKKILGNNYNIKCIVDKKAPLSSFNKTSTAKGVSDDSLLDTALEVFEEEQ